MQTFLFKKDLCVEGHETLAQTAKKQPVLSLYILEMDLWYRLDMRYRHYALLQACLHKLDHIQRRVPL